MMGTPKRIFAARNAWLAAKDAWLAAAAALEAQRLEVNRLWLEYLDLADPERARKIRKILKHGEQGAAKTADELFPAAVSFGQSKPRPQSHGMQLRTIIRAWLQLQDAAALIKNHLFE